MGLPMMKITPQIVAMRIRENKWDALDRALNDLFLDLEYEVNMPMLQSEKKFKASCGFYEVIRIFDLITNQVKL